MIEQMLALSTAHMPNPTPNFGELRSLDDEYGIIVFVYSVFAEDHHGEEVPQWIRPIMKLAREKGCRYIYFDRDVSTIDGLQTWDW